MGLFSNHDRDYDDAVDSIPKPTPSEQLKNMGRDVHNALDGLRSSIDAKDLAKTRRVEEFFAQYEAENQKLVVEHCIFKSRLEALEEAQGACSTMSRPLASPFHAGEQP